MRITRLSRAKSGRINLFVDGQFLNTLSEDDLVSLAIYKDKEIDESERQQILQVGKFSKFYNKVVDWLSLRPRSIYEVTNYLKKRTENDLELIDAIISRLENKGLLDDFIFAKWWLESRISFKHKSKRELKSELLQKGISGKIIERSLAENVSELEQVKSARYLVAKKSKMLSSRNLVKRELEEKLKRYLAQKGFDWSIIKQVLP